MNFSIQKATGQKIPCIARIPENAEHIVISIHGIGANKQDTNAVNLLQRLPEAGIGVVVYDQPGHGDAASDTLSLRNCLDSLSAVEHWVRETYPAAQLGYVGSSFGAYVLGMYVGRGLNSGKKAFMRCAAVIFPEIILGDPHAELDPQAVALLDRQGYLETIVEGNVIRLPRDFLYEIRENSMVELYSAHEPEGTEFAFAHGGADQVVPVEAVRGFAAKHGYPFTVIPGEGHSINSLPGSEEKVAEMAIEFFKS